MRWETVKYRLSAPSPRLHHNKNNALNDLAPQYLTELLVYYTPAWNLRSTKAGLLTVPAIRLKSMGDKAFSTLAQNYGISTPWD